MIRRTIKEIAEATGGEILRGSSEEMICRVVHDSRKAQAGDLFFAITGETHDGHTFIPQVAENGCRAIVISDPGKLPCELPPDMNIIVTGDTRTALQDLAGYYLADIGATVIGVTGSTGKTSTKDMMYCVASQRYKTGKTEGNFNNDIGMPLTILGFDEDTEVAVLEMGMDHFGEIDLLAKIARPSIGLITNIGISHMENLGSREGIMKAKMEITNYFTPDDTLIISTGQDLLRKENIKENFGGPYQIIATGTEEENDYVIRDIQNEGDGLTFLLEKDGRTHSFYLPVPGRHNALNAALTVAAGDRLGIDMETAAAGLQKLVLTKGRLTVKNSGGLKIIDDTYNASPDSVKGAVDVLVSSQKDVKIAVLGDMYELGEDTEKWHRRVGEYAAGCDVDRIIAVGEIAKSIAEGAGKKGVWFKTKEELMRDIGQWIPEQAAVLVKGSRGMKMEEIVGVLIERGKKE